MGKGLLFPIAMIAIAAALAGAQQTTDPNPGHTPDVFLDNHRPLIQKKGKPPVARTVTGKVVDDGGQPLEGAMVILTNGKSGDRTEVVTKKDGRFNFDDVSFNIDYQLQARYKSLSSESRKLSQYDHAATVVRILQIEPEIEPQIKPGSNSTATQAKKETPPQTKK